MTRPLVRVAQLGTEGEPIVIIDQAAPDPERLIAQGCAASLERVGDNYPGLRAPVDRRYHDDIAPLIAAAARRVFGYRDRLTFDRVLFSLATTPPGGLSVAQRLPHVDTVEPGGLAMVHYLARCDWGGTRFFRQRSTGFETIGPERYARYLAALSDDLARVGDPPPGYIAGETPMFTPIGHVTARFNRLVLYRSNLLHCAAIDNAAVLPADPATGRLTIAGFLSAA